MNYRVSKSSELIADRINDLESRLRELERREKNRFSNIFVSRISASSGSAALTIGDDGDVYSEALTDYSATSTVTGWSSFTFKKIHYKRVGKSVFFRFNIQGIGSGSTASFTLPYSNVADGVGNNFTIITYENGIFLAVSRGSMDSGVATVTLFKDVNGAGWINGQSRLVVGQSWYEAD